MAECESEEQEPVVATVFIAVNEDRDWDAGADEDEAAERLRENYGGNQVTMVKLDVDVTAVVPKLIEVSATLPEREDGSYSLEIKQS
jgi:hypothetical protein